jgi:hypothetical protein
MTPTVDPARLTPGEQRFWELAEPLLARPGISRSTMMGFPCLRVDGQFFASTDRSSGDLIVKLPAARVDELVTNGQAETFAPAGRPFREWAAVPYARMRMWKRLLDEAHEFVAALPPKRRR